jgi:hypothetical protein
MTFAHLKGLSPEGKRTWVRFPEIGPNARIEIAPASEANPEYFNAALRRVAKKRKDIDISRLTAADFESNRAEDRDLFGRYVVTNFEGFVDDTPEHKLVPFSREAAMDLCQQLPYWLFDRLRTSAMDMSLFVDGLPDPEELKELAGNSESGSATI